MRTSFTINTFAAVAFFTLTLSPVYGQQKENLLSEKSKKVVVQSSSASARKKVVRNTRSAYFKPLQYDSQAFSKKEQANDVTIVRAKESGLPLMIKTEPITGARLKQQSQEEIMSASFSFLDRFKSDLKIIDPKNEFEVVSVTQDDLKQTHVRMQQKYKGIPVFGAQLIAHTQDNQLNLLNGRHFSTPRIATTPTYSSDQAVQAVIKDVKLQTKVKDLTAFEKKLLEYDGPESELIILHTGLTQNEARLAWHIMIRPNILDNWTYFVDAANGQILKKYNSTCTLFSGTGANGSGVDLNGVSRTFGTYLEDGQHYLIDTSRPMFKGDLATLSNFGGGIITLDAQNTSNYNDNFVADIVTSSSSNFNSPAAVSAHYNAGIAYEYFLNVHNRNSINGQGGSMFSIVNMADADGSSFANATWNGKFISYGNGGDTFKPLAASLDVAGHEMSHGVVENSAGLEYQGQSGAINESISDIFGAMMDRNDWKVGEDIVKPSIYTSGALRDLSNPHNGGGIGWQPAHMSEYVTGDADHGGVHDNSGIVNYAYYLIATQISKEKSERIYYRALTVYLTKFSQFVDLRLAVTQAATDLHGAASAEVNAVKAAFDAVGILEGTSTNTVEDLTVNPGQDFILVYNTDPKDPNVIYASSTDGSSFAPISSTKAISKLSVTDDGSAAFFVDANHMIKAISLSGSPQEIFVDNQPIWDNVAVSKDGTKIAMATTAGEPYIYVRNLVTNQQQRFELYNPTTSDDGGKVNGVLYPDALEWDYSGEYIVYDAANRINSSDGEGIEFWDVGAIKVWDNLKNNYAEGIVQKLFTDLPAGVSVGNPSFSKNSPHIIAFDVIRVTSSSVDYAIISVNLETGDGGRVYENNTLGYPSYSKLDDKLIFDSKVGSEQIPVTATINLLPNKLEAAGEAKILFSQSAKAVWFTQGERKILSGKKDIMSFDIVSPIARGTISGNSIEITLPTATGLTSIAPIINISKEATISPASGVAQDFTRPVTYTVRAQDGSTKVYTVTIKTTQPTGIDDVTHLQSQVQVYPNPFTDKLNVKVQSKWELLGAEIYTIHGKRVNTALVNRAVSEGEYILEAPNLTPNTYLLKLTYKDHTTTHRIIKI